MGKKFWIGFIVSAVLLLVLEYVYHGLILVGHYKSHAYGFLPEHLATQRMFWLYIGIVVHAFIWTYLYNRFVPAKTAMNGAEFGVLLMILYHIPWAFTNYSLYVVSGYNYLYGAIGGIVMGAIIGAVMGVVMKTEEEAK